MKERLANGKLRCTWLKPTFVGCSDQCRAMAHIHVVPRAYLKPPVDVCRRHVETIRSEFGIYESYPINSDHDHGETL